MSTNSIVPKLTSIVSKLQEDINGIIAERDAAINTANMAIAAANEIMTHKKGSKYRLVPSITAADLGAPLSYLRVNNVKLRTGAEQTTHMLKTAGLSFFFKWLGGGAGRVFEVYSPDTAITLRATLDESIIKVYLNDKHIVEAAEGQLNEHMSYAIGFDGKHTYVRIMSKVRNRTAISICETYNHQSAPRANILVDYDYTDDDSYQTIYWNGNGEMGLT